MKYEINLNSDPQENFYRADALSINCRIITLSSIALLTIHTTMASYTILITELIISKFKMVTTKEYIPVEAVA